MDLYIIGAGAQGRVALDLVRSFDSGYEKVEFLDDNKELWQSRLNGALISGPVSMLAEMDKNKFRALVALGNPLLRAVIAERLASMNVNLANIVHPSAYIAPSASLGGGNTVCAHAVINSQALLKDHVLVNNSAIVEHDSILHSFTTVCPGAKVGGRVELLEGAFICTGAIVLPRRVLGRYCVLAAGSILTEDLPDNVLAMGQPAKAVGKTSGDFDWRRLL